MEHTGWRHHDRAAASGARGLARPLLTLLGLLLLAAYVLVSDGSRLLAKEHDGDAGTRDCTTLPTLICVGNVGISGLGASMPAGSSDGFNVNATNLVSTTTSNYTLKVSVPSSSPIGFNSNCSDKSESWQIEPGETSKTKSATLYGCRATSAVTVTATLSHSGVTIETDTHNVTVDATKPNPVGSLNVTEGNNKLTLTWTKPTWDGGRSLTGYQVQNNEGTPGWPPGSSVINNPNTLTFTVSPLVNDREYGVRVRACNAASLCSDWEVDGGRPEDDSVPPTSTSTPTPTPTVTAETQTPPGVVTGLVVDESTSGQLTLTWNKPDDSGSAAITGYHVQNKRASDTAWPPGSSVIDHTVHADIATKSPIDFTVAPLVDGTTYDVRVQACNADGLCNDTWTGRQRHAGDYDDNAHRYGAGPGRKPDRDRETDASGRGLGRAVVRRRRGDLSLRGELQGVNVNPMAVGVGRYCDHDEN